jgi:putative ABC transport system ATP-binding protein
VITHNAVIARMADRVVSLSGGLVSHVERNRSRVPARELEW